jgi:DUF917 family protein
VGHLFTRDDLQRLAIGAGILGTGGGGNPYLGTVLTRQYLPEGAHIEVVDLDDVPDDALVTCVAGIGAPTVGVEMLNGGKESYRAMRELERHIGRQFTHLIAAEIGGANSLAPFIVAAQSGLPVIDGDGMGRAFPELQMATFVMGGVAPTPAVLCSYHGYTTILDGISDPRTVERYARTIAVQMGGGAGMALPVMTGAQVRETAIPGAVSLATAIGAAVIDARGGQGDPVEAALEVAGGRRLFTGTIVSVERRTVGGFSRGELKLAGNGADSGRTITIDFQNENLIVRDEAGRSLAVVPDLICLVDEDYAEPVTTEIVRYGLRVVVLGIPAPEQLKTENALSFVGPAAFGYDDVQYEPMPGRYGQRLAPISR